MVPKMLQHCHYTRPKIAVTFIESPSCNQDSAVSVAVSMLCFVTQIIRFTSRWTVINYPRRNRQIL